MSNFKLTIEYDGTSFHGWQIQANGRKTIQGEIETALQKIFKKRIKLVGSGRTDSGVHAQGQIANFNATTRMLPQEILKAINTYIPNEIVVLKVAKVAQKFHAQHSAKSKVYRYSILNRKIHSALNQRYYVHFPYKLDIQRLKSEAKVLLGRHDFQSFTASNPALKKEGRSKDTVRTIKNIEIKKCKDLITIEIEANGFLYKMVRNIVGTLLEAGSSQRAKGSLKKILHAKNRNEAGTTAPAHGLSLIKVRY